MLDALAAAHGECRHYEQAVAFAEKAYRAAIEKSQGQTANTILSHLRFYHAGKPFRETPKTESRAPDP